MLEGDKYYCPRFTGTKEQNILLKAASEICGRDGSKGTPAVLNPHAPRDTFACPTWDSSGPTNYWKEAVMYVIES